MNRRAAGFVNLNIQPRSETVMRLANILVSFAATAMAAWIFMFASEVRAEPTPAHAASASVVSSGIDRLP